MRLIASALAVAAVALLAMPAAAAPKTPKTKHVVVTSRGSTVFYSRDESGRARTRIIVQKRSYLDPGTDAFPGEHAGHDYAWTPTQHAGQVIDHTAFGRETPLPGPFTLPSKRNPWLEY